MIQILLVEDDPGDARLMREAFIGGELSHRLVVVRDGGEALRLLRMAEDDRPDIILMDLNLPQQSGRALLQALKSDDTLRHIPVIVLSTSNSSDDIQTSYHLHANCYITKPDDYDSYVDMVRALEKFWFHIAQLPS